MGKVLILGGYGNFGKRIAYMLARQNVPVIVSGRDLEKAKNLVEKLPQGFAEPAELDVKKNLAECIKKYKPVVVINTCGPFQECNYDVAEVCIDEGAHYIDLSDARDFVVNISALDVKAKKNNVAVISGASTVPGLSSAVIEHFLPQFTEVDSLKFGIAPGQKAERGLATTQAILGYVGKKLQSCAGQKERYGWQDLYVQKYPQIGNRLMANCEVPDLDLLPKRYGIKKIQFSAGMENPVVHIGVWLLSWLVRFSVIKHLQKYASVLLKASNLFDFIGSADGGMHMLIRGKDKQGKLLEKNWFIIALAGDGPYIPTIPAVVLAKKLLTPNYELRGALPCLGLVSLREYLQELDSLKVSTFEYTKSESY